MAGTIFAGSPFLSAHLNGHFHLEAVWVFPLFALAFESAAEGSIIAGAIAGAILAASAFIDYYYVVYEGIFAVIVPALAAHTWRVTAREAPRKLPLARSV